MEYGQKPPELEPSDEMAVSFMRYHLVTVEPEGYYDNAVASAKLGAGTWCRLNFDESDTGVASAWLDYYVGRRRVARVYWDAETKQMELYEHKTAPNTEGAVFVESGPLGEMVQFVEERYCILDETHPNN